MLSPDREGPHKIPTVMDVKHIQEPAALKHQQSFRLEDLKDKDFYK